MSEENKKVKESNLDYIKNRIETKEDIHRIKAKKGMSSFGKLIISFALLGVVIIGVIVALDKTDLNRATPDSTPDNPVIVITDEELAQIQELSTAKYTYTETQSYEDWKKLPFDWNIPFTKKAIELKCTGEIKVFYDMSDCTVETTPGRVTVTLPESQISHNLESALVKEQNNIFNPISLKDQNLMEKELKIIMESRAIEKGMFDEAKDSAEQTIYNLVEKMLDEGQVLDVHQSAAAIQADAKYIKDTTEKAQEYIHKYKISNINE